MTTATATKVAAALLVVAGLLAVAAHAASVPKAKIRGDRLVQRPLSEYEAVPNRYAVVTLTRACPSWLAEFGQIFDFLHKGVRAYQNRVRVESVDGAMAPRIEVFEYDAEKSFDADTKSTLVKRAELKPGTKVDDLKEFLAEHGIIASRRGRARFVRNEERLREREAAEAAAELGAPHDEL